MAVTLYTSKALLQILGVEKYGVWNLLAAMVVLFSFVQSSMATAIQRYISFFLGKNAIAETYLVLYNSKTIHVALSLIFIVISEIVGNVLLVTVLDIPDNLKGVTFWLFQIVICNTVLLINRIPYNAWVIAHEKMSFYSITSVIEGCLTLLAVYALKYLPGNNLFNYGILCIGVTFMMNVWFYSYCRVNWNTSVFKFSRDKKYFKELLSFSSYTMLGSIAHIMSTHGINVLINMFFGVTVNAAMGIATQVNGAVLKFVTNFQTAFKPQIVKLYSSGNSSALESLIFGASKISFFLMWILAFPILMNADFILQLWLDKVPMYTSVLCKFMIVCSLLECVSSPLWMTIQATGNIKKYQVVVSITMLSTVLGAFILFSLWGAVYSALCCKIVVDIVVLSERLYFSKKLFGFNWVKFIQKNIVRFACVVIVCLIGSLLFRRLAFEVPSNMTTFVVSIGAMFFISLFSVAVCAEKSELNLILGKLKRR